MAHSEIGSPAMMHNKLKSMQQKGWITFLDTEDARRKQVSLSQAALMHFAKLSNCLVKAAKESGT